ncbi:DUF1648 domain-containing protein [Streptomyces somaliensis]|uniref:DUF1648 domain-containing protein n=1 Tax=Streptomyces somaliensis TaxID=78355 RepID=UPI0020CB9296|nr:DUF1648 domain-containing protein [Streptomyces somaliensis]
MSERAEHGSGTARGVVGWAVGVLVLLAGMPLAVSGRLPERMATHWSGAGRPDGSMPLWAAAFFPALIWTLLVAGTGLGALWAKDRSGGGARGWASISLLAGGVFMVGGQASVVRANLDRTDWRQAGSVTGQVVVTLVVAVVVGLAAWRVVGKGSAARGRSADGPRMELPAGRRFAWFSRASNPWLHATAAVTGAVALIAAVAALIGLTAPHWPLIAGFALTSILVLGCASVQVAVSEKGLKVSFGPFGWPVRRWAVEDIESARAEDRSPSQVGGWGYRLSGMGTTVMLRGGECLVIRAGGGDFAVSVDDAERGAALLNSLAAGRSG